MFLHYFVMLTNTCQGFKTCWKVLYSLDYFQTYSNALDWYIKMGASQYNTHFQN